MSNLPPPQIQEQLTALAQVCDKLSSAITAGDKETAPPNVANNSDVANTSDANASDANTSDVTKATTSDVANPSDANTSDVTKDSDVANTSDAADVSGDSAGAGVSADGSAAPGVSADGSAAPGVSADGSAAPGVSADGSAAPGVSADAVSVAIDSAPAALSPDTPIASEDAAGAGVSNALAPRAIRDDTSIPFNGNTWLYGDIMQAFENMQTGKTTNRNNLSPSKLDEVYNKLKTANTTVEVQNILREHNFAMGGNAPAKRFVQRVVGGTRKPRMHRRKKTQRKRSKTIKKKNRAGKRK